MTFWIYSILLWTVVVGLSKNKQSVFMSLRKKLTTSVTRLAVVQALSRSTRFIPQSNSEWPIGLASVRFTIHKKPSTRVSAIIIADKGRTRYR
jgi:hypothetical protein